MRGPGHISVERPRKIPETPRNLVIRHYPHAGFVCNDVHVARASGLGGGGHEGGDAFFHVCGYHG